MNLKKQYNISQWDQYKLNYWAIPKCANTAIKTSLANLEYNKKMAYSKAKWVHNPDNVLYIDRETATQNQYLNFTVTRNPYDRFLSLYKDQGLRRPIFKDLYKTDIDTFLERLQLIDLRKNPHTRLQTDYIFDNNNQLVDKIIDIKKAKKFLSSFGLDLNYINKTEEIDLKLNDSQKENIYNLYKEDFKKLGYDSV